jgi:hypothetical protein
MTFAGEKTCEQTLVGRASRTRSPENYQANTFAEGIRKCTEDGKSGIEPLFRAVTIGVRLNELLNMALPVKNSENRGGRLARFEFGCELMGEKIILGLLFIIL